MALRDIHGLSQTALAEHLGVTQSFLSHIEKGTKPLPATLAVEASAAFGLPLSFFAVPDEPAGRYTFRKKARAGVRDERRVQRLHDEASRLFRHVSVESNYRQVQMPSLEEINSDPETAAEWVRDRAGLGPSDPVPNVLRLIERMGIGVICDLDDSHAAVSDHAGISRSHPVVERPTISLLSQHRGDVLRMSAGHELGHLIFDRNLTSVIKSTRSPEERRAFNFSGALLLPEHIVRKRVSETLPLQAYLRIKADYGLSVGAILKRAEGLGVISAQRYRSLSIQLSSQGWRTEEPVEVKPESPRLLHQALERVYGDPYEQAASRATGVAPAWIRRWTQRMDDDAKAVDETSGSVISLADRRRGLAAVR
ncbi:XRE family transcriptional regulator [Kocuria sp.]|uniref:XRE family transcriptional regulator n=1 Tax=Kocuria sp. TaxID=1871328 RepID=UPI0034CE3301